LTSAPDFSEALSGRPEIVLQEIISAPSKLGSLQNPFDCVSPLAVSSGSLGYRIIAMLDAITAFFCVVSAGIFIAHALDGYRSRL
jgi:hypothetical protein